MQAYMISSSQGGGRFAPLSGPAASNGCIKSRAPKCVQALHPVSQPNAVPLSRRVTKCSAATPHKLGTEGASPEPAAACDPPSADDLFEPKDWANCFQSQDEEFNYCIADIDGKVPDDLKGTLFRVCPGTMEIGDAKCEHWLDGDGYAMAFTFEGGSDGCVTFQSRYVATPERVAEQDAGKVLYRNTFGTQPEGINFGDINLKNPANTNVVFWGGKLLALWEAGSPFELDPSSLATKGAATLGGWVKPGGTPTSTGSEAMDKMMGFGDAHTAHPHVVEMPEGDRLVTWKWKSLMRIPGGTSLQVEFREYDEEWNVTNSRNLDIPSSPMAPHDFAVTDSSYVLTIPPMNLKILPYLAGMAGPAQCVSLAKGPMRVYVCPRNETNSQTLAINEEAIYYIHYANAFDDGDETVLRGSAWGPEAVAKLADNPRDGILGSWDDLMQGNFTAPVTSFWEHRINRQSGTVARRLLFKQSMDHPRVNPAFYGRKNRFVYFNNCAVPAPHDQSGPPQMWTRLDVETGEAQQVYFGPRFFTEELIFVPREGSDDREDWGYLLGMMYSAEDNRTALVVLDASDFNKGAVCKIWLDDPVPHGLHGFFTPEVFT